MSVMKKKYESISPFAQRHLFLPSHQVAQASPVEVEGMSFSCEHLRWSPSSRYPKPSLDAADYLQAHRARGTGETSGSFITFLTKEALLSSGTWLSIGTLRGKSLTQLSKDTR